MQQRSSILPRPHSSRLDPRRHGARQTPEMSLRTMLPRAASGWAPTAGPSSLVRSAPRPSSSSHPSVLQLRFRGDLAPRRVKYRKAFKGSVPVRTGGSLKGTTLEIGEFGIRTKQPCRLSAKVLKGCETAIKKGLKSVKEAQCYLRVFPQIPVCVKGNETRMGKGKGAFEYWACRCVCCLSLLRFRKQPAESE